MVNARQSAAALLLPLIKQSIDLLAQMGEESPATIQSDRCTTPEACPCTQYLSMTTSLSIIVCSLKHSEMLAGVTWQMQLGDSLGEPLQTALRRQQAASRQAQDPAALPPLAARGQRVAWREPAWLACRLDPPPHSRSLSPLPATHWALASHLDSLFLSQDTLPNTVLADTLIVNSDTSLSLI